MAGLRIFVSSTCYDLAEERQQVRNLLISLGHDPILSDHNDVHYGNNEHTHISCIRQVSNADMVILLVGSRYGGVAIDEALDEVNLEIIQEKINNKIRIKDLIMEMQSRTKKSEEEHEKDSTSKKIRYGFSITHFEILRAIQEDIPIYAFVKDKVWNFNELYTMNRDIIENITIPSIEKHQSKYLFEFLEILKNRKSGNSVFAYSNYLDIEIALKKQLAEKLKSLMDEQKNLKKESEDQQAHIDRLTDRFDDLKTAILSTLPKGNEREVAKGVVKFRRLLSILFYMLHKVGNNKSQIPSIVKNATGKLTDFFNKNLNIIEYEYFTIGFDSEKDEVLGEIIPKLHLRKNSTLYFLKAQNYFFYFGFDNYAHRISDEWEEFVVLTKSVKEPILDALIDEDVLTPSIAVRYFDENFEVLIQNIKEKIQQKIEIQQKFSIKWKTKDDGESESYSLVT